MTTKLTYRKGFLTKKCLKEILEENNISGITGWDSYDFNHSIYFSQWGQGNELNDKMLSFIDKLAELGIKVSEFREAKSPMTGLIKFSEKIK